MGLKLAENNGFLEQFNEARIFENKNFLCSTPKPAYGIKSDCFISEIGTGDDIMIGNKSIKDYHKIVCSGYRVVLCDVKKLPEIDVSDCLEVLLTNCDFSKQTHFVFKDNARVNLIMAKKLPPDIDFSQCSEVSLCSCNLVEQHNLSFKDGATVNLYKAYNLPSVLDASPCEDIDLYNTDFSMVERLIFKNRKQMENSHVKLSDD